MYKLSIIIPVFNEVNSVGKVVDKIKNIKLTIAYEIILVDSGSSDGSTELIRQISTAPDIKSIFLRKKPGQGLLYPRSTERVFG